jgi:hypothetical protein
MCPELSTPVTLPRGVFSNSICATSLNRTRRATSVEWHPYGRDMSRLHARSGFSLAFQSRRLRYLSICVAALTLLLNPAI